MRTLTGIRFFFHKLFFFRQRLRDTYQQDLEQRTSHRGSRLIKKTATKNTGGFCNWQFN